VSEPRRPASPAAILLGLIRRLEPDGWASVLVAAIAGGLVAMGSTLGIQALVNRSSVAPVALGGARITIGDDTVAASVAQRAAPSVVSILTQDPASQGASGFLVTSDGYIVTGVNVVAGASHLLVMVAGDSHRHDARLVDFDCQVGLAILKIDDANLAPLSFGDSSVVQPGQTMVMVGGALPSRSEVTRGVVSAVGRDLTIPNVPGAGDMQLAGLIETDVSWSPEFNGGPLLNPSGQVVGVLSEATLQGARTTFALPSNTIQAEVQAIAQKRQLQVPSLGTGSTEVTADQAALEGGVAGSKITAVTSAGPADQAGLHVGDVITRIDDQSIDLADPLPQVLRSQFKPGQRVTVTYSRDGRSAQVQLRLTGERPACG
jgi:S1-C subfamily serine protease